MNIYMFWVWIIALNKTGANHWDFNFFAQKRNYFKNMLPHLNLYHVVWQLLSWKHVEICLHSLLCWFSTDIGNKHSYYMLTRGQHVPHSDCMRLSPCDRSTLMVSLENKVSSTISLSCEAVHHGAAWSLFSGFTIV